MTSKESLQENQYHFPYHHLTHESKGAIFSFRHLFWGLEHYTYIKFVIDKICVESFTTLIDIGCGEGRILSEIESRLPDKKLSGVDISARAIYFAKGFTNHAEVSVHDITLAPHQTPTFDLAVSCEVIEHILPQAIPQYISHIAASLTPNGQLILTTPTTNVPTIKKHYQHFTLATLTSHLAPYFTIEEVCYLNKAGYLGLILERAIANRFFISNLHWYNYFITQLYTRYVLLATENTGSRIYIKARKK